MTTPSFPALDAKRLELKSFMDTHGFGPETKAGEWIHRLTGDERAELKRLNDDIAVMEHTQRQASVQAAGEPGAENGGTGRKHVSSGTPGGTWAAKCADAMSDAARKLGVKALTTGSIDVPSFLRVDVVALPTDPGRLIDLLVDRVTVPGNEYEYLRQTVRTNNAAPVADHGTKPTSIFTVEPVEDRARVIAHLSEPIPERFFADHRDLIRWLESEMFNGVADALEDQIVNGDGLTENMTGLLNTTGIRTQPFATDAITSLRTARTTMENAHEMPTAWVMNPTDVQSLDLLREDAAGMFLSGAMNLSNIFGDIRRVVSTSVPAGTALLGDWRQIRLVTRQDMRLDADRSGTLFAKNEVVLRAEGRFGIGVLRPSAFVSVDLTA